MTDNTAEVFAARAKTALQGGNYLLCYDLVHQAEQLGVQTRRLQYLSLLALANAGSIDFAWRRYRELGLREEEIDEDWLALQGRLLKDLALAGGGSEDFRDSAQAYLGAFRQTGGYFTAINAATMFLLAGESESSHALAREVLSLAGGMAPADDTDHYYLLASEAEAALLLNDTVRCRNSLQQADRHARGNVNARSRTRQQLRLICRHLGLEDQFSALLSLPALFYIDRNTADVPVAFSADRTAPAVAGIEDGRCEGARVFAALQQPADLCAAEYFLARGARLSLVLSAGQKTLIERWQRVFGAGWAMRLARCLTQVGEFTVSHGFLDEEQEWAGCHVAAMAEGLARLTAQRLGGQCHRVELAATATPPGYWLRLDAEGLCSTGLPPPRPAVQPADAQRRFVGLIFADIAGFRRLRDEDMPRFWARVMGSVAQIIARHGERVLFRHTWGDAINVVTDDATTAADIAVAIQSCIDEVRRSESGPMSAIELRLAVHFAPAFSGFDPIENVANYYGSQLSFTARIEPVTPPGMIFVTEAFAARLALESPDRFAAEYAGEVELAKRFGKYRLFSLHAVGQRRGVRLQLAGGTATGPQAKAQ
ncbi:MAG: adenylate/guanylate cyclase domain-containing protein [Nevskia sp.]|nr:adenylate/guanylate cyclase domain-containing protein [Nevskia sp.]